VEQINQATNINVGNYYKHKQKYKKQREEERTQANLFTQFGPILT